MKSKSASLTGYHNQMLAWKSEGLSYGDIANQLQTLGVLTTKGRVYNYFVSTGLLGDSPVPEEPEPGQQLMLAAAADQDNEVIADSSSLELLEPAVEVTATEEMVAETAPTIAVAERFPEIDRERDTITQLLNLGCSPDGIHAILAHFRGLEIPIDEMTGYIEGLREELFPLGPIAPELFEVPLTGQSWPDDMPILKFGEGEREDVWTVSDFARGTAIFGSVGSGKTSGSGRAIAGQFLKAGYGGLVLTVKQSESLDWVNLAKYFGRELDIALIKPRGGLRCNLLQWAISSPGEGREFKENIVAFFQNLVSVVSARGGHRADETFWRQSGDQLLRQTINAELLAGNGLTLDGMLRFVDSAPTSPEMVADEAWREIPGFGERMRQAEANARTPGEMRTFQALKDYWLVRYTSLSPNTRSCVTFAFSAMVDAMRDEHIYDLLSTYTNITPECIFNGRIVILELPINEYHDAGLMIQAAWKYCVLRAALQRSDMGAGDRMRPVFLWEDEAQNHIIDFDAEFQPLAREYRVARVMLTQNIQNLYNRFGGGQDAQSKVESLLGSINTRIFHANGDHTTNQWASDSFGTHERAIEESSFAPQVYQGLDPIKSMLYRLMKRPVKSISCRTLREPLVHPHEFLNLRTGGAQNGLVSEAFVSQVGRVFSEGWPVRKMAFRQLLFQAQ